MKFSIFDWRKVLAICCHLVGNSSLKQQLHLCRCSFQFYHWILASKYCLYYFFPFLSFHFILFLLLLLLLFLGKNLQNLQIEATIAYNKQQTTNNDNNKIEYSIDNLSLWWRTISVAANFLTVAFLFSSSWNVVLSLAVGNMVLLLFNIAYASPFKHRWPVDHLATFLK